LGTRVGRWREAVGGNLQAEGRVGSLLKGGKGTAEEIRGEWGGRKINFYKGAAA